MALTEAELTHWLEVGQAAQEAGRHREAAEAFTRVRDALPGLFAVAQMAADAWRLAGDALREREAWRVAAAWSSSEPVPVQFAVGGALLEAGAPAEALAVFDAVARALPHDPAVLGARAGALRASGRPREAWPLIERAVQAAPRDPALLLTAAQVRHALGDPTGALAWLDRADARRPNHGPTQRQRALTRLLHGRDAEGWALFEARGLPTAGRRAWNGEPLDGADILVLAEQGVGDQFHFVRYLPLLAARGARRVVLAAAPATVRLFAASGIDAVPLTEAPATTWEVPLLSLPHRLGLGDEIGVDAPYLRTGARAGGDPGARDASPGQRPRVGLVWKGNPAFGATVLRDFDAALLPALLGTPGVQWVWLQYDDAPPTACDGVACPSLGGDWLDTARLLETLDAVVSVDTGLAHLAGAMGVPGYLLLPHVPDWRWGWEGETTPWYPSLTLLRQPTPRDWASVLTTLQQRLAARFP